MLRTLARLAVLALICRLSAPSLAKDVFVAVTGADSNPGTRSLPLASIQKGVDAFRGAESGTLWIGPGEYYLEQGVVLDAKHGGTAEQPLVIRGTEPGNTRLSGARIVKDFQPISAKEAESLISETAKQKVLVSDLRSQGIPPLDTLPEKHRAHGCEEVVFDDRPMQSARWPNEDFATFGEVIDSGASEPYHWVTREVYRPGSFRFPGDRAKRWDFERGVWLHGFWSYDWADEALKVDTFDAKTGELRLAATHAYGIGPPKRKPSKRRFYAIHVFEELDQPGEYYLDRKNDRLYFWPPGDLVNKSVLLTCCAKPLIEATDVSHLVIRDLTVENGRGTGVLMENCQHSKVENCHVRNMGRLGIDLSGTQVSAVRCEVTRTASCGIRLHSGDRKTLTPGNSRVEECHVHHVGRLDWMGGRAITMTGCGNRIANNLLHHGPTGAVNYRGNEHLLEFNEVHNFCKHYSDVGVFYTGRDWASRGNVVRWNFVHNNTSNKGDGSAAFYLDDCDSGDTIVGNVVLGGVRRGVLLGGGRDNTIRGNLFIDLPIGVHVDARGPRGIVFEGETNWNLLAKCEQVGYLSPLWTERYPRLAKVMDQEPLLPMGNSIRDNAFVGCTKSFALSKEVEEQWLDRSNNLQQSSQPASRFVDGSTGKLNLPELRTLWQQISGFEPIPVEKIGLSELP